MPTDPAVVEILRRRIEIRWAQFQRISRLHGSDAASAEETEAAELAWLDAKRELAEEMRRP